MDIFEGRQTDHKVCGEGYSWLPKFQLSIFTVRRDQIVVRVMFDADHILVMNLKGDKKKLSYVYVVYVYDFFSEQGASSQTSHLCCLRWSAV